ncbi:ATP-binding cassette domain-containing protein [Nonomuraea indica]|uniref:ATP-binding cassette domain-containing protein n=1 Tax=Nonomuraea indica TaxID=1581193 RepID=UPI003184124F
MNTVLQAQGLGKKYGKRWALRECTIDIPAGHVVGLVGPNGAGKTTLLKLASGQLEPTAGDITVLGGRPAGTPAQLAKVGFVAQDTPVYAGLPSPSTCGWGHGSTPAGTPPWRGSASRNSASIPPAGRASCRAASAPSSPSPWAWPSGPSC